MKIYNSFIILLISSLVAGINIKDWGTGVQMKRLAYSTRDLFKKSFDFLTAGQNGVYPIADLKQNYTQIRLKFLALFRADDSDKASCPEEGSKYEPKLSEWHGITAEVKFMAYNGWLEGLRLDTSNLSEHGRLRRMVMTGAEKSMASLHEHSENEYQHEIILCDSCLRITAKRVHYAYETVFYNYETSGTLTNEEITVPISFTLTVSSGHNKTIGRDYCSSELEPLALMEHTNLNSTSINQFSIEMNNVGIFNFLSEYIDGWMQEHFNTEVYRSIQRKLDISVRKMLNTYNPCEQFLSS